MTGTTLTLIKKDSDGSFADVVYARLPDDLNFIIRHAAKHRGIVGIEIDVHSDSIGILLERSEDE